VTIGVVVAITTSLIWPNQVLAQDRRRDVPELRFERLYEQGQVAIEHAQWKQAVDHFSMIVSTSSPRADAALYWRAYALDKMNRQADALTTVAELTKTFPKSRWVTDAKALEIQVLQRSGRRVSLDAVVNEDLRLFVIQGLQQSEPEQAIPMLERVLQHSQSPGVKERALFILAQSPAPQARQVLTSVARASGNPDLQMKAIRYIGLRGPGNQQLLGDLYATSTDVNVKRQIIRGFTLGGNRQRIVAVATSESSPELRAEAVRQLGWLDKAATGSDIVAIYRRETRLDLKEAALDALVTQQNEDALLELARKEADTEMKRLIEERLSIVTRK